MERIFEKLKYAVNHLEILHEIFQDSESFSGNESHDHSIYLKNSKKFTEVVNELSLDEQLYGIKDRSNAYSETIFHLKQI